MRWDDVLCKDEIRALILINETGEEGKPASIECKELSMLRIMAHEGLLEEINRPFREYFRFCITEEGVRVLGEYIVYQRHVEKQNQTK